MEEHQFTGTKEGIKNIQVYSSWVVRGTRVVYTCTYQRYMLVIIHNTPLPVPSMQNKKNKIRVFFVLK
jgi:hypothetical protein